MSVNEKRNKLDHDLLPIHKINTHTQRKKMNRLFFSRGLRKGLIEGRLCVCLSVCALTKASSSSSPLSNVFEASIFVLFSSSRLLLRNNSEKKNTESVEWTRLWKGAATKWRQEWKKKGPSQSRANWEPLVTRSSFSYPRKGILLLPF